LLKLTELTELTEPTEPSIPPLLPIWSATQALRVDAATIARSKAKEKPSFKIKIFKRPAAARNKETARTRTRTSTALSTAVAQGATATGLLTVATTATKLIQKCQTFESEIKASFYDHQDSIDFVNDAKASTSSNNSDHLIKSLHQSLSFKSPESSPWIKDMDVILRAQIYATHNQNPRRAAQAYATAMTSVIFTVLCGTNATSSPKLKAAANHLVHMATPLDNYPHRPPTAESLTQFIALHFRIARTTPTSKPHAARITASSAIISLMIHSLSTIAVHIPLTAAAAIVKATIIRDTLLLKSLLNKLQSQ
jgi:hypothetical protein